MMFVIIHHCSMPYLILNGSEWVKDLYCIIMPFTMSTFTMISGYFHKEKPIMDRINSYLIPCLLFSILNICLQRFSLVSYIYDMPFYRFGYAMWYLYVLFVYNIITQILMKKISVAILLCCSIILALSICSIPTFKAEYLQFSRLVSHYPFFLIGIILHKKQWLKIREHKHIRWLALFIFVVFLLGNLMLCKYTGQLHFTPAFDHPVSPSIELYGLILCSILSICLLLFVPNKEYTITRWGGQTLTPYVLHMSLILPICWTFGISYMNMWYGMVIYMVITPVLCLLLFNVGLTNSK